MQSNKKQSAPKKDSIPKKESVDRGRGGGGSTEKKSDQHQRDPIYSMPSIPKKHGNPGQVPPSVEAEKKEKGKEKEKYVSMDLSGNFGGSGGQGTGTANGNGGTGTGNGGNGTGGESTSLNNNSTKRKIGAEDEQEKPRKKIHLDESLNPLPIPKPNPIPEANLNPNPVLNPFLHHEDWYPIPDGLSEGEVMFFYHTAMDAIYRVLDYAIFNAMHDIPPDDKFFIDLAEMAVWKPRPNDNPEIPLNYRNPVVARKVGKDPTLWEFNTKINFLKSTKYEQYFTAKCSNEFGFKKFIGLLLDLKNDRNKVVHEKEGGNFYSRKIVSIFLNLLSLQRVFGLSILSYVEKKDKTLFHHLLYKCALGRDLLEEIKEVKDENRRLMERKIVSVEEKVVSVEDKIAKVVKEKVDQVEDTFRNRLEANEKTMKTMEIQLTELKEEHRGQLKELKEEQRGQIAELQKKNEELQRKNEEQLVGVQNQVASLDTKITSLSTTNERLLAQLTQVISTLASNKTPKDQ